MDKWQVCKIDESTGMSKSVQFVSSEKEALEVECAWMGEDEGAIVRIIPPESHRSTKTTGRRKTGE